jgi:hypothetical protein
MSQVYREVGISVGMGEYPTNFTTAVIDVMTENDIAKLLVEFPPRYASYRKIVDIGYITSSQVYRVETYEMSYSDELEKYFFFIGRKFTYGERVYLQFRCLYENGQESVDAAILRLKFRPALRIDDFISYENNDLEEQSEILEKLVIQHANVNASTIHTGHVRVDGVTIVITASGVISAVLPTPPPTPDPLSIQVAALGVLDLSTGELLAECSSYPSGGESPYSYSWKFGDDPTPITTQDAFYIFDGWFNLNARLVMTDANGDKLFGGAAMVEDPIPAPPIPDVDADFKVWVTATIVWTDVLQFNLESTVVGGTGTHTYEWYLGTSVTPVTTPNAYVEFVADISEIDKIKFRLIVTDEDGRAINIRVALSYTEG